MTGATLSLKMISVEDGSAQWFYRHSVENEAVGDTQTVDYYYHSEGTKITKGDKIAWGLAVTSIGVASAVIGARLNEHGDSFAKRNIGFGLAWASILPLTVGTTLTIIGIAAQAKKPVYETPDKVLCARPPVTENPFEAQHARFDADAPEENADDTYGPSQQFGPSSPQKKHLVVDALADHFIAEVTRLSEDRTRRPPDEYHTPAAETTEEASPLSMPILDPTPSRAVAPQPATSIPSNTSTPNAVGNSRMIVIEKKPKLTGDTATGRAQ
jgi:hypothetical protein